MAQLRGRRIAIGSPASGVEFIANRLLGAAGLAGSFSTMIPHTLDDSVAALQRGNVDAFIWSGGLPTPKIAENRN